MYENKRVPAGVYRLWYLVNSGGYNVGFKRTITAFHKCWRRIEEFSIDNECGFGPMKIDYCDAYFVRKWNTGGPIEEVSPCDERFEDQVRKLTVCSDITVRHTRQ